MERVFEEWSGCEERWDGDWGGVMCDRILREEDGDEVVGGMVAAWEWGCGWGGGGVRTGNGEEG